MGRCPSRLARGSYDGDLDRDDPNTSEGRRALRRERKAALAAAAKLAKRGAPEPGEDDDPFRLAAWVALTRPAFDGDDGALLNVECVAVELLTAALQNFSLTVLPTKAAAQHVKLVESADCRQLKCPVPDWPNTFVKCMLRGTILEDGRGLRPLPAEVMGAARFLPYEVEHLHIVMAAHLGALFAYWDHTKIARVDALRFTADELRMQLCSVDCGVGNKVRVRSWAQCAATYAEESGRPRFELLLRRIVRHEAAEPGRESQLALVATRAFEAWQMVADVVFHGTVLEELMEGDPLPDEYATDKRWARLNGEEMARLLVTAEGNMRGYLAKRAAGPAGAWFEFSHTDEDDSGEHPAMSAASYGYVGVRGPSRYSDGNYGKRWGDGGSSSSSEDSTGSGDERVRLQSAGGRNGGTPSGLDDETKGADAGEDSCREDGQQAEAKGGPDENLRRRR